MYFCLIFLRYNYVQNKRQFGLRSDGGVDCYADFLHERRLLFSIERALRARSDSFTNITAATTAYISIITQKTYARQNTLALHHNNLNCGFFVRVGIFFIEIVVEKSRVNAAAFECFLKNWIPLKTLK